MKDIKFIPVEKNSNIKIWDQIYVKKYQSYFTCITNQKCERLLTNLFY